MSKKKDSYDNPMEVIERLMRNSASGVSGDLFLQTLFDELGGERGLARKIAMFIDGPDTPDMYKARMFTATMEFLNKRTAKTPPKGLADGMSTEELAGTIGKLMEQLKNEGAGTEQHSENDAAEEAAPADAGRTGSVDGGESVAAPDDGQDGRSGLLSDS